MDRQAQKKMPVLEALERFKKMRVVPFDVPGHKRGRGNKALLNFLGEKCLSVDVNSMKPLDNLCHPVSVIKEAEELAASLAIYVIKLIFCILCLLLVFKRKLLVLFRQFWKFGKRIQTERTQEILGSLVCNRSSGQIEPAGFAEQIFLDQ